MRPERQWFVCVWVELILALRQHHANSSYGCRVHVHVESLLEVRSGQCRSVSQQALERSEPCAHAHCLDLRSIRALLLHVVKRCQQQVTVRDVTGVDTNHASEAPDRGWLPYQLLHRHVEQCPRLLGIRPRAVTANDESQVRYAFHADVNLVAPHSEASLDQPPEDLRDVPHVLLHVTCCSTDDVVRVS